MEPVARNVPGESCAQFGCGQWTNGKRTEYFRFQRIARFVSENVERGVLGIAPHGKRRVKMRFVDMLLAVEQSVGQSQPDGLRLGAVDDASGDAKMFLRKFFVHAFPEVEPAHGHVHGAAFLGVGDELPKFTLERGKFLFRHTRGEWNELGSACAYPEEAVGKTVEGLHVSEADGKFLHGDVGEDVDVRPAHGDGVVLGERCVFAGVPETADTHGKGVAFALGAGKTAGKFFIKNDEPLVVLVAQDFVGIVLLSALAFFIAFIAHKVGEALAGRERAAAFSGRHGEPPFIELSAVAVFASEKFGHGMP